MSFLDTRHKRKSFTLTTFLLSVLILLMFYVGLSYMDPPIESGISVNFGTTAMGSGKVQPLKKVKSEPVNKPVETPKEEVKPVTSPPPPAETAKTEQKAEKVVTQEDEESVVMKKAEEAKKKAEAEADRKERQRKAEADRIERERQAEAERIEREKKAEAERVKQEQDAKKKKLDQLMGGLNKSDGTESGGEGNDRVAGDKGRPDGDPYASSYYGSPGSGSGGIGYGLNGRKLVASDKFLQDCNESGRVVVQIVVDRNGRVVSAEAGVKGTTNNNPCLLEPARRTALSYRWNVDSNAPDRQIGFIVVNFKLGE